MKKIMITLFCFLVLSATLLSAKTVKMTFMVYDNDNKPISEALVEVKTNLGVFTGETNQAGQCILEFRREKKEIPDLRVSKKGFKSFVGSVSPNSEGNMMITLED